MMSSGQLEKKYDIFIADDSYYNPLTHRFVKAYKYYSADGCLFSKGLRTMKAVAEDCQYWSKRLLAIKKTVKEWKEEVR